MLSIRAPAVRLTAGGATVKYILLIHHDEESFGKLTEDERQRVYSEYRALREQMKAAGQHVAGDRLHPTSSARHVRVRDGKQVVTSGPFAETREQLGGYFVVDVDDLDEAIAIAARIPSARTGTIEVRQVAETAVPSATT
jgi:hypothetical protein